MGEYFQANLKGLMNSGAPIKEVRGLGLMIAVEFSQPIVKAVAAECMERGLIVNAIGDSIIRFLPPLTIGESDVDEAISILASAIRGN
jgi:4-aminobutyrate aminotransferase-like enzyme